MSRRCHPVPAKYFGQIRAVPCSAVSRPPAPRPLTAPEPCREPSPARAVRPDRAGSAATGGGGSGLSPSPGPAPSLAVTQRGDSPVAPPGLEQLCPGPGFGQSLPGATQTGTHQGEGDAEDGRGLRTLPNRFFPAFSSCWLWSLPFVLWQLLQSTEAARHGKPSGTSAPRAVPQPPPGCS